MNIRIELFCWALFFVGAVMYSVFQIMGGVNLVSAVKASGSVAPASGLGYRFPFSVARVTLWVAAYFLQSSPSCHIQVFFSVIIGLLLGGIVVAQVAINKGQKEKHQGAYKLVMIAFAIVVVRLIIDRPGSAKLGGSGGGGEAVLYAAGFLTFWAAAELCSRKWNIRANLRVITVIVLLWFGYEIAASLIRSPWQVSKLLYGKPSWLLASICLASLYDWTDRRRIKDGLTGLWAVLIFGLVLIGAALTGHRSRPLYAVAQMLGISFFYKRFIRAAVCIGLMGIVGVGSALVFFPTKIPPTVKRAISTVFFVDSHEFLHIAQENELSVEVGWHNKFRVVMFNLAKSKIKKHPFVGNGFSFELQEIMDEFYRSDFGYIQGIGALAMAGGYHSSVLALAVFTGLPCTAFCFLGLGLIVYRFSRQVMLLPYGPLKRVGTILIGFFIPACLQMLINGKGYDFYTCMTLLGFMYGFSRREDFRSALAPLGEEPEVREAVEAASVVQRPRLTF